jgi:uncharacterized membrane protein
VVKGALGMITVEVSLVIKRPVDEVFAFLADLENNMRWRSSQIEVRKTSKGPISVGTTYRMVNNVLGRRIEGEGVVTEYEQNRKYTSVSRSGYLPLEARRVFEPVDGGTRVTLVLRAEPAGFFKIAQPLFATMARRRIESDAANLKDLMESGAL